MPTSRVVVPETKLLQISNGDWLLVKKRLNHGEYREALARKYLSTAEGVHTNLRRVGTELITAYLVDWSLTGLDGKQIPIAGKSPNEIDQVLDSIDFESVAEIKQAIDVHEAAMEAERSASKKILDGATKSPATSPSLDDVAGDTSGSENSTPTSTTSLSTH